MPDAGSAGRERLCRYVNRPPLAYGRLQRLDAEQIVVSPHELIEKLSALVPPPRIHLIRYPGVLAPNAADRALIVPAPTATDGTAATDPEAAPTSPVQRLKWAQLLARVFYLRKYQRDGLFRETEEAGVSGFMTCMFRVRGTERHTRFLAQGAGSRS